ncbi:UvrABC system protein [Dirofilaria immitis]
MVQEAFCKKDLLLVEERRTYQLALFTNQAFPAIAFCRAAGLLKRRCISEKCSNQQVRCQKGFVKCHLEWSASH